MSDPQGIKNLRTALEQSLSETGIADVADVIDVVLRTLDQQKVISYAKKGDLQLLTTHGRTLVAILENPGITQRALSVYLGISESNVQKSIKALEHRGLIAMTKVKNSRTYEFVPKTAFQHPDITRFFDAIISMLRDSEKTPETGSAIQEEPAF